MINYETALEWATEYLQENYPTLVRKSISENVSVWRGDYTEFILYAFHFQIPMFQKEVNEFRYQLIYDIKVPSTKKEFYTVLDILDN